MKISLSWQLLSNAEQKKVDMRIFIVRANRAAKMATEISPAVHVGIVYFNRSVPLTL